MDIPGSRRPPRKKRDPEKNKKQQKQYRQRLYAAVNGIEDVKALHRRRYHERMARMKANGEYEAFKAKKTEEGMRRYYGMTEEQRAEVKRKNNQCQKKLNAENERPGDVRGVQRTFECEATGDYGREKASVGRGGVEGPAESAIPESGGIHSTSKLVLVGRGLGASLSPPVVAFGLDRVRP